MNLDQLNDMYIDVLREIGNIGTGNATIAVFLFLCVTVSPSGLFFVARNIPSRLV